MTKIKVVKQQDLQDCGVCSLSCIIDYYGGYVPLEKIRIDTCTTKSGTTAFHLINAAKSYGFDAMGVKVEDITNEDLYFPAIAHVILENGLNHFVVIYKISSSEVWLMDPAKGKIKMKIAEFEKIWDNIIILMMPIKTIITYDKKLTISSVIAKLILHNKSIFIKICLINIILMIFTILGSFYFQVAIGEIQNGSELIFIKILILIFLWFTIVKVVLNYIKDYYLSFLSKNLDCELYYDILQHIFNLPLKFTENRSTGEVMTRIQELGEIKEFLIQFFTNVLLNSILVIGSSIVLYSINSTLFLTLGIIIIIYLLISTMFSKLIYEKVSDNIDKATNFTSIIVENIEMNNSINNLNLVTTFLKRIENKLIIMLKSNFGTMKTLNVINVIKDSIYEIGLFLVTTYGIFLIYQGKLELLKFITFNSLILYLFNPIREFIDLIPKYNYLKASFRKLSEFINVKEEVRSEGITEVLSGDIEFSDVTYSYNHVTDILQNVNLNIQNGDKIMLKGPSGSGKSTVCSLIRNPNYLKRGTVKIANVNQEDYKTNSLNKALLYVGQNEKLFSGTIWDNITCYRNIDEGRVMDVIKICELGDLIDSRPHRYQTLINASINNLSGGERQRIILARALLKEAKIIILDEALSEVNIDIEKTIINNIIKAFKNSTIIYVSHKDVTSLFSKIIDMEEINGRYLS